MEKRRKPNRAGKDIANQELKCIIQLWRAQRRMLNQSLERSICSDLDSKPQNNSEQHLESLCEGLMDYVSVGHFKVYEKLLQPGKNLNQDQLTLVKSIYHNIENSTDHALCFNDKYDEHAGLLPHRVSANLPRDLHKLNRSLTMRFVLEEQLVEILKD